MKDAIRSASRPRVLIADDHPIVAEGVRKVLQSSCEIVGVVGDGRALLEEAPKLLPDVIVLDIAMPFLNGFDAAERLKESLPDMKARISAPGIDLKVVMGHSVLPGHPVVPGSVAHDHHCHSHPAVVGAGGRRLPPLHRANHQRDDAGRPHAVDRAHDR